jgi:hypothetical protein
MDLLEVQVVELVVDQNPIHKGIGLGHGSAYVLLGQGHSQPGTPTS